MHTPTVVYSAKTKNGVILILKYSFQLFMHEIFMQAKPHDVVIVPGCTWDLYRDWAILDFLEREKETDRQTKRERGRERQTDKERKRESETYKEREGETKRERERDRQRDRQTKRERELEREGKIDRMRVRLTDCYRRERIWACFKFLQSSSTPEYSLFIGLTGSISMITTQEINTAYFSRY